MIRYRMPQVLRACQYSPCNAVNLCFKLGSSVTGLKVRTLNNIQSKSFRTGIISKDKEDTNHDTFDQLQSSMINRDTHRLKNLLEVMPSVNMKDRKGWTPLMLNAKYGDLEMLHQLLNHGADAKLLNRSGQTATEIAAFFNNRTVYDALSGGKAKPVVPFFTASPLRREAEKRGNQNWILENIQSPKSRFLPVRKGLPLVVKNEGSRRISAVLSSYAEVSSHLAQDLSNMIFLGLDKNEAAYFSVDFSNFSKESLSDVFQGSRVITPYPEFLFLSRDEAAISGQAHSLWDWHHRHQFCPTCGSRTYMAEAGYKRKCGDKTCSTNQGIKNTSYPRVDPTVICTVVSPDEKMCLLGRKASFPPGMYSCLAGFAEPGEGIEDTCIREVQEEVGIRVADVRYIASQPWPVPSSLMIGCQATAESTGTIKLDEEELEDAQWFSREDCVGMLTMTHPRKLWTPPTQALANQLITSWVLSTSFRDL